MTATLEKELSPPGGGKSVLSVDNLSVRYSRANKEVLAVESLCFDISVGRTLAIVGESGSGKTTVCRAVNGLLPSSAIVTGEIWIDGNRMSGVPNLVWSSIRGRVIAMVLQDTGRCLNPSARVGQQISDAVALHLGYRGEMARREAESLMDLLKIDSARTRFHLYPHELSGGMRQRVAIAIAIAGRPRLLIADESVRALDPIAKSATLKVLKDVQRDRNMGIMLVSHNLYSLDGFADEVMVMYSGRTVERAATKSILDNPLMPYSKALLIATPGPAMTRNAFHAGGSSEPRSKGALEGGCGYFASCEVSREICRSSRPNMFKLGDGHMVACWHIPGAVASE